MGWSAAAAVRAPHTFPCPLGLGFEPLASRSRWRRAARSSARRAISIILMACSRSSGGSESRSGPSPFTALRRFPSSFGALCQGTRVRGASGAWERAARARPGAGPAARLEAAAHLSSLASGRGRLRSGSGAKPRVSGASWDRAHWRTGHARNAATPWLVSLMQALTAASSFAVTRVDGESVCACACRAKSQRKANLATTSFRLLARCETCISATA